jgi:hypothetical protein
LIQPNKPGFISCRMAAQLKDGQLVVIEPDSSNDPFKPMP